MSHMEKGELKIGLIIGKRSNCSTRTHTPRPRESGSASSFVHIQCINFVSASGISSFSSLKGIFIIISF